MKLAQQSVDLGLGQLHPFDEGLGKAFNLVSMLFEYLTRLLKADLAKARSYWLVVFADEIVNFTHVGYRADVVCGGVEQLLSITTSGAEGYSVPERIVAVPASAMVRSSGAVSPAGGFVPSPMVSLIPFWFHDQIAIRARFGCPHYTRSRALPSRWGWCKLRRWTRAKARVHLGGNRLFH